MYEHTVCTVCNHYRFCLVSVLKGAFHVKRKGPGIEIYKLYPITLELPVLKLFNAMPLQSIYKKLTNLLACSLGGSSKNWVHTTQYEYVLTENHVAVFLAPPVSLDGLLVHNVLVLRF